MPVMNSTGALKIQKNVGGLPTFTDWMSVTGKSGTISSFDFLHNYNDEIYINFHASTIGYWWIKLSEANGLPTTYTQLTSTGIATAETCSTVDNSGNTHIMTQTKVLMYDSNNNFIRGATLTTTGGFNATTRIYNDAGYLYIVRNYTTSFRIVKIRISDYSVIWSNTYSAGVTFSSSTNDPFNILFHSSGDLIVVGGDNTSKTYFYVRMDVSGTIIWQNKYTFVNSSSTGVGTKSVLDSSDYLYVMSNIVVSGTVFTNILIKIDTSTGTKIAERTLSTTSDFYQLMKIHGNNLYLATFGVGFPGPNLILTVIDTSFTAIQNHNINDPNKMILGGMVITSTNCYFCYQLGSISNLPVILKLPLNTDLTTVTSYGIPGGLSGTLTITKISDVTFTTTSVISLTTATITTASVTLTTVAATDSRTPNTPIKYVKSI